MITQKKLGTTISFDFVPDGVKYSMKDKNHSETFTVPYEEITRNTPHLRKGMSGFAMWQFTLHLVCLSRRI